jgi:hypothetical protein
LKVRATGVASLRRSWAATLAGMTLVSGVAVAGAQPAVGGAPTPGPKLQPIGEVGNGFFGISVALSAKGGTALVGASNDSGAIGGAWAFTRSSGSWRQEGRKLLPGRQLEPTGFGLRVALSADGNTALIGGPLESGGVGAARVFVRSGSGWRQTAKLTPRSEAGRSGFGESVALSADSTVALVGGPTDALGAGAAWIFTRSGSTWKQGSKLTGRGEVGPGRFGVSVALSSNGRIAAVGGPLDANAVGSVWTFVRTGAEWSPEGSKLTIKGGKSQAQFGSSLSLSATGSTALIGAPVDDADVGTAWVFTRSGSSWRQQGKELTAPGKPGTVQFGGSVALSGSGDTALVGGAGDNGEVGTGAVWLFTRSGSAWSHEGTQLARRRERGSAGFGSSVAISTDGSIAVVGGYNDDHGTGAAWEYHL